MCAILFAKKPLLVNASRPITAPANSAEWSLRWYFTFSAAPDTHQGHGTVVVDEHVQLWAKDDATHEWVLEIEHITNLNCSRIGQVRWEHDTTIVFNNNGFIKCKTIDLREEALMISDQQFDICNGQASCELAINDVLNEVNIYPPSPENPFLDGPLFVYEEVVVGGAGINRQDEYAVTFDINQDKMQASIPRYLVETNFYLTIAQDADRFSFEVNNSFNEQIDASQIYTYFNSSPETIYFGYNPETKETLRGSIINGIFDPFYSCPACPN
ncbi:MAG: hypothetical protein ACPG8W_19260 [Candidatus Promineifilaceae bacterium]